MRSPGRGRSITRKYAESLLLKLKSDMAIDQDIRLVFKPYKQRVAVTSINKRIVRLNERILDGEWTFNNQGIPPHLFLEKVLRHELMHIKLGTRRHPPKYFKDLI